MVRQLCIAFLLFVYPLSFILGVCAARFEPYYYKDSVKFSYTLPISVSNPISNSAVVELKIRPPLGMTKPKVREFEITPFSKVVEVFTFHGEQYYPEIFSGWTEGTSTPSLSDIGYSVPGIERNLAGLNKAIAWVEDQIEYKGFQSEALTLQELHKLRQGDCTEHALLLEALLQETGFRTVKAVDGFYLPEEASRRVSAANAHSWVVVYFEDQWLVVDALYRTIKPISSEYIVMNSLVEGASVPLMTINSEAPIIVKYL